MFAPSGSASLSDYIILLLLALSMYNISIYLCSMHTRFTPQSVNYPRGQQFKICRPQQRQLRAVLQQQLLLRQHLVPFV
jgi:hypothetical protein